MTIHDAPTAARAWVALICAGLLAGCGDSVRPETRFACGDSHIRCIEAMTPDGLHDHDESWRLGIHGCDSHCESLPGFRRYGIVSPRTNWIPCSEASTDAEKAVCRGFMAGGAE